VNGTWLSTEVPEGVTLRALAGGIGAVAGVRAAACAAGLRSDGRDDLALVDVGSRAVAAVTVTTNQVRAAPCELTLEHVADGHARAVVANSGNANACTGAAGLAAARASAAAVASALGCDPEDVLVLSTGVIGVPLAVGRLVEAVPALAQGLAEGAEAAGRAAAAVMTTDTVRKEAALAVDADGASCVVGGFAKGAGMIEPAMATMLGVIVTDAALDPTSARRLLSDAVHRTFDRISVDACGSTNDTVVLVATGTADRSPDAAAVGAAIERVCATLAHAIVDDGEGTGKVCRLEVVGAPDVATAEALGRAVTASVLFRAALHGGDPNWGRILAAMGTSPVRFDPDRVAVRIGEVTVCRDGAAAAHDRDAAAAAMAGHDVDIVVDLGTGRASATLLTADLTPEYVAENAYYTT
jgi:glutamate N-acetyltransferase/amino-acid N-acetyltransferase